MHQEQKGNNNKIKATLNNMKLLGSPAKPLSLKLLPEPCSLHLIQKIMKSRPVTKGKKVPNPSTTERDDIWDELKECGRSSTITDNKQFLNEDLVSITKYRTSLCDEPKE